MFLLSLWGDLQFALGPQWMTTHCPTSTRRLCALKRSLWSTAMVIPTSSWLVWLQSSDISCSSEQKVSNWSSTASRYWHLVVKSLVWRYKKSITKTHFRTLFSNLISIDIYFDLCDHCDPPPPSRAHLRRVRRKWAWLYSSKVSVFRSVYKEKAQVVVVSFQPRVRVSFQYESSVLVCVMAAKWKNNITFRWFEEDGQCWRSLKLERAKHGRPRQITYRQAGQNPCFHLVSCWRWD